MIATELNATVNSVLAERLRKPEQQALVVSTVMERFDRVQKKPVPDLPERMKRIEERVRLMAEKLAIEFVNGKLVVRTDGPSEALMTEFRRGSDWYEPWDQVDEIVLAAILTDPSK